MEYDFEDEHLGTVQVRCNVRAKRFVARRTTFGAKLTIPPRTSRAEVERVFKELKPRLLKMQTPSQATIDEQFTLETYTFRVEVVRTPLHRSFATLRDGVLRVCISQAEDIYSAELQAYMRSMIEAALRSESKRVFPSWLEQLAHHHNFSYSTVKINGSRSRWGSCSNNGSINLSYFLLLLPKRLIELVLLHELCHTRFMNHSPQFWHLLDEVTGGNLQTLNAELKLYRTYF